MPGNAFAGPHALGTPSRKCRTAIVPVVVVKPGPGVGAVVSRTDDILIAGGPDGMLKLITCGLTPPVKLTVKVKLSVAGHWTLLATVNRKGIRFVPLPPSAARSG